MTDRAGEDGLGAAGDGAAAGGTASGVSPRGVVTGAQIWTEAERLAALHRTGLLDTSPEQAFDDLVRLAAELLGMPMAGIHLVDADRQWGKAEVGLGTRHIAREVAFCPHTLLQPGGMVVPDATRDPRFADNPLVTGGPGIRFYAGMPLEAEGLPIGALCVLDTVPHAQGLDERQLFTLRTLAAQVSTQIALRRALAERNAALTELTRRGALQQQTLNSVTDYAIISTDPQGRVSGWNTGAENVLGWTEAEMLGQPTERFFTPEDRAAGRPAAEMREALESGRGSDERWHVRADGRRFWANGTTMPLRDEAGAAVGFVKVLRDRTEQHRAEQALRDAELGLRRAQEAGRVGVFTVGVEDGMLQASPEFCRLYGLPPRDRFPAAEVERLVLPEDAALPSNAESRRSGEVAGDVAYRIRRADTGELRWIARKAEVERDADGRPLRFVGVVQDITEQRAAQQAVAESEARYRALIETIDVGFCVLEMTFDEAGRAVDYRVAEANPAFERQTGADVLGRWVSDFAPDLERHWFDTYGRVALTGQPVHFENGAAVFGRWFDVRALRIGDPAAHRVAVLFSDITGRKRMEDALVEERNRLAQMFEQAPTFMAMLQGPQHRIELANPGFLRLVGHREVLGRTVADALPDAVAQGHLDRLDEVFRTGRPFAARGLLYAAQPVPGGPVEEHYVDFVYSPIRDAAGQVSGIFVEGADVTDRALAERGLRQSEAQFRVFAQAVPSQIWAAQPDGRFYWFNDQVYNYAGATPEQLCTAEGWTALIHPDDLPGARAAWAHALRTGEVYETEFRVRRHDGAYRWFLARAEAVRDEAGGITGWVGTSTDIHDRKQQATALAELNEVLEQRVEARTAERNRIWQVSRDMLLVADLAGVWLSVNPSWTRVLGWEEAELVGQTSEWLEHPDDRARTRAEMERLADGRATLVFENRFRTRRGDYRILSWTAVPAEGLVFCVARDVTEERESAAALRLYEKIIQSDRSPVCAFDTEYRLIAFNQAHSDEFFRIYGHRVRVGEVFPDLFLPDQAPVIRGFMARALAGESFTALEEFGDPTLAKPHWEVSYTPLRDAGGRITGAFHHANDVSSRLRAEAELQAAQDALRQSQKMEAVGQLTGGIAHDFNNLLTGIIGSLELLNTRVAQGRMADAARYVSAAQGAARRAAALTHRLLAFSRRQTLDPRPTDANRLVRGMEELIRRTVGPAIDTEVAGAEALWPVLVDPPQLENALLNLCINARDAMPDGGQLRIETANTWLDERAARERDLPPGAFITLSVSDTGAGMTPEVAARAFDPFFTTKPLGQGTGLGLSMIYGFVRQSGGQVRIYSAPGEGTTVRLYLPRHLGEAAAAEAAPAPAGTLRARAGQTVLVVDDEATVRMLVAEVLEELGYAATEAADGAAGLRLLQSEARVDLLVTDVGLPGGMNGRQLADAARAIRPGLRVLFITGYAENAVVGNGQLEAGMQVLTKPFAMEALASRIKELIDTP
ncbi:PAS domain S-box protein [Roseomonas sp. BN140053]|uniref:PAS domain S-box protein n=1 Tax=Roseomonas sp. BN140053 TaxID=3391898 RepID=UPI0039E9AC75